MCTTGGMTAGIRRTFAQVTHHKWTDLELVPVLRDERPVEPFEYVPYNADNSVTLVKSL
jgi:hypothetical protein